MKATGAPLARVVLTVLVMVSMLGVFGATATAKPPPKPDKEQVAICHYDVDGDHLLDPSVPLWELLLVKPKAVDSHMDHGDGYPDGEVPGTDGAYVFDEYCVPQPVNPAETIFAVAYSDKDTGDGGYDPAEDVLIAKLVDDNGNATLDSGDKVVTFKYPIVTRISDWSTGFNSFAVTEHTITAAEVGTDYVEVWYDKYVYDENGNLISTCVVSFIFRLAGYEYFSESQGSFRASLSDRYDSSFPDVIDVQLGSPSEPETQVVAYDYYSTNGDDAFIDVDLDIIGAG
jgi:hypothetical protein